MKKDIRNVPFKTIAGWRGDSLTCPQAFGGDTFAGCSMGCWWCFCREMEEGLYKRYYTGWDRELVRPCEPDAFRQLFDRAFGSDRGTNDWLIKCLRYGLPFNLGSKAETFCLEDLQDNVVVPILELFRGYQVPVIIQTKSHYVGLRRYLDILKDLKAAIIISIMGGSDTLNYQLEPGAPPASMRWALAKELGEKGFWVGVRWEPILGGINSSGTFKGYAQNARDSKVRHVSFYNYRTSNYKIAQLEFENRGYDYPKMLKRNLDENWRPVGERFFEIMRKYGIPASTPDFINFPLDSVFESCCGVDGLFRPYHFTFQRACSIIKERGSVCWTDMEEIVFREPQAYERMKKIWNGGGRYYSLADSPKLEILDKDSEGFNVYGAASGQSRRKKGFLY